MGIIANIRKDTTRAQEFASKQAKQIFFLVYIICSDPLILLSL